MSDESKKCKIRWGGRWIIGGDFNMTLRREERNCNCFSVSEAAEFKEIMDMIDVVDLSLAKGQCT